MMSHDCLGHSNQHPIVRGMKNRRNWVMRMASGREEYDKLKVGTRVLFPYSSHARRATMLHRMEARMLPQTINWLLESDLASIRYKTLKTLHGLSDQDPLLHSERQSIVHSAPIQTLLSAQTAQGSWPNEKSYYTPKYTSTHWSMLILHEAAVPGDHPVYHRGVKYMLAATRDELNRCLDQGTSGLACFWGNLHRYALAADPENPKILEALQTYLEREALHTRWQCKHNNGLPCAWGAARSTWALAALPAKFQTEATHTAIPSAVSFLLEEHSLFPVSCPPTTHVHSIWSRLNFPLFYQADILFVLRVLAEINMLRHPGAAPALDWLQKRSSKNGRWRGASPFRKRTWPGIAESGETDRWVSLQALQVLRPTRPAH